MVTENLSKYNVIACQAVHKCRAPDDAFRVCVDRHIGEYIVDMVSTSFSKYNVIARQAVHKCRASYVVFGLYVVRHIGE